MQKEQENKNQAHTLREQSSVTFTVFSPEPCLLMGLV